MARNERTLRDYALPSLDMNNLQFRGITTENSNEHLKWFLQLYDTFKYNRVTDDTIFLRLFPFSLIDNSFSWLDSQAPGSFTTWDNSLEISYRNSGRSYYKVWERFKMLIQKCPHNRFPEWMRLQAARGTLMNRTYEDAYEIIENMGLNSY
ncbi:Retrotransposon gag protein [Gossypium australe]|uniref:Retrotransposon gag protein n=1 Tax=Gossypium australe TaxID=47621 RepID=A0A5B6WSU2_9ROSI|nr:Retrotransposon gag protein [Gossypium australe]